MSGKIIWISLHQLRIALVCLLHLAGDEAIVGGFNIEAFPLAHSFAKFVGFLEVLRRQAGLVEIAVGDTQGSIGAREVGIQLQRPLMVGKGFCITLFILDSAAIAKCLQSLQR